MFDIKAAYKEIFEIEMDGWCFGIEQYPGEIFPGLIHGVIRELKPSFVTAIEYGHAFDILALSAKISKSAKYLVHEKEIAFSILAQFPRPGSLSEEGQYVMAKIIDQVEQHYGGALERLQRKWAFEKKKAA